MQIIQPFHHTVHIDNRSAVWQLSDYFLQHIPFHNEQLIFCCIGTDRSTGDALGPLIGNQLDSFSFPFTVFGTLEKPVHALNLIETQAQMEAKPNAFIVAIDACLGEKSAIGSIVFRDGALFPGKAVNKKLPPVGHLCIKGIVNVGGFMETAVLQNTRLHITYTMSKTIANAILLAWQRYVLKNRHACDDEGHNRNPWQQIGYSNFR